MKKTNYTTSDIAQLGIKRERLKVWMEKGWIKPSVQVAEGAGTKNLFNRLDLYIILLFKYLVEHGFTGKEAYSKLAFINPLNQEKFLGQKDYIAFFKGNYDSLKKPEPICFPFNINDEDNSLVKVLGNYLPKIEAVVIINFIKIKEQVEKLSG